MKKLILSLIVLILPSLVMAATRNVVPRATHEGSLGTPAKYWSSIYVDSGSINEKLYVGSMTVYGTITTTNAVTASVYYGDGSQLTGITAGGGGGGGQIKVVIDSGTVFTTVSTINVTQRDFASAFTAATWTVRLSSNVARLDGSSETFNLSSVLNLNSPQLYFNGTNGFGGGQDFAEFNVSNTNPRYFIIRNNNNAGSSNLMMSADQANQSYMQTGNMGPTWNDTNNGQYLQGSAYLALVGSGRYGIIDRNPLGGVQTRYLMYFTSGTVGINTSTQSAVLEIHSTSSWRTELPLLLVSSETGKNLFLVNKSSTWVEIPLYISSAVMRGTLNTDKQVNITGANLTLGSGHFIMGGTFGNIVANTGQTSFVGIKFGNGTDFTGFQGFQSTVTFIAYDPTVPTQSGEVGRYSTKYWTFFSSFSNTSLVNISSWSAVDSPPIGLLSISSNVIKGIVIPATFDFWSGSFTSRVPIIASSMTATGTITASQFRGDGSALTGITATTVQSLPLIEGATNYIQSRNSLQQGATFYVSSGTVSARLYVASMTVFGTITSTSGFVGDGSKLTGITASAVQSLPLIAGDTGYFAIYSTRTISATQTFQSSVTFSSTSLSIGGNLYHFQSSAPAVNTVLRYDDGGKVFWGNDASGGASSVDQSLNYNWTGSHKFNSTSTFNNAVYVSSSIVSTNNIVGLVGTIGITVDGGGSAITTGVKGYVFIPYDCTISSWVILADQSGSITFDVWNTGLGSYPPTVGNTITAADKPAISGATFNNSAALIGWNRTLSANDVVGFNVDSAATITRAHLYLMVRRR